MRRKAPRSYSRRTAAYVRRRERDPREKKAWSRSWLWTQVSRRTTAAALGTATMAVFWGTSVSLYLDRRWTAPIWKACRASSGRDWMLNSGVFRFGYKKNGMTTHALSTAIFATYPVWLWLGHRHARRSAG